MSAFEEYWAEFELKDDATVADKILSRKIFKAGMLAAAEIASETETSLGCWCDGANISGPITVCGLCKHCEEIRDAIRAAINGDDIG